MTIYLISQRGNESHRSIRQQKQLGSIHPRRAAGYGEVRAATLRFLVRKICDLRSACVLSENLCKGPLLQKKAEMVRSILNSSNQISYINKSTLLTKVIR